MRVGRVALFGHDFPNLLNHLLGLRDGFRQLGIDANAAWPHPSGMQMETMLDQFRPDAVIEINRSRDQISDCDARFVHVAWMMDLQSDGAYLPAGFGGSDLTYFIFPPSSMGYDPDWDERVRYLMPGTNPDIFRPGDEPETWDFSFVGQMFAPPTPALMDAPVRAEGRTVGRVGDLIRRLEARGLRHSVTTPGATLAMLVEEIGRDHPGMTAAMLAPKLRVLFEDYLPRMLERRRLLDAALAVSPMGTAFFGTGPWDRWPAYAPHFRGYLNRPSHMASVFRRSRAVLHNGPLGLHFRTLDAMAAGRVAMLNETCWDGTPWGVDGHFAVGTHFLPYRLDDPAPALRDALADPGRRRRIGAEAARAVRAGHTWRHRAMQIVEDLTEL